jgi:FkbM family methyltransferase
LVIAVEPSPENLECLRRNLAEEIRQNKVIVYPKGVWDRDDFLEMNIDPNNTAANSFVRKSGTEGKTLRLPLTTVDNLVRELQLSRVDFIKIDIEGAERKALEGARETLKKFKPRMAICVYHLLDDPVVVPRIVASMQPGYTRECDCQRYSDRIQAEIMHFY